MVCTTSGAETYEEGSTADPGRPLVRVSFGYLDVSLRKIRQVRGRRRRPGTWRVRTMNSNVMFVRPYLLSGAPAGLTDQAHDMAREPVL